MYSESRNILFLLAVCFALFLWKLGASAFLRERRTPRGTGCLGDALYRELDPPNYQRRIYSFQTAAFSLARVLVAIVVGRVDEFTVRFPSAILGTLDVLMTYYVARRLWTRKAALVAAVVLATSFGWWQAATITQVDMTLTFSVSAALMLFISFIGRSALARRDL